MYSREIRELNDYEDKNEPRGTVAVVARMYLKDMPSFVRMVEEIPGARLVYQRTSAGRLRIVAEE